MKTPNIQHGIPSRFPDNPILPVTPERWEWDKTQAAKRHARSALDCQNDALALLQTLMQKALA